jgi:hypothetical protein
LVLGGGLLLGLLLGLGGGPCGGGGSGRALLQWSHRVLRVCTVLGVVLSALLCRGEQCAVQVWCAECCALWWLCSALCVCIMCVRAVCRALLCRAQAVEASAQHKP